MTNTNSPHISEIDVDRHMDGAVRVAETICREYGTADAIARTVAILEALFMYCLHARTPMPENNIAEFHKILDTLKEHVKAHEECSLALNPSAGGKRAN